MAYRQYTRCTSRSNYIGKQAAQVIIAAAIGAIPLLAGAAVGPGLLLIALYAIIAYCRWWLYDRLICLGQDVCAVGMLLTVEPPSEKSGLDKFDTDYSINLVLSPHHVGDRQADVESDGDQGWLVKQKDPETTGLDFTGHEVRQWSNYPPTACLHAEFEGAGVYDLLMASLAALALAAAAAVVCAIPVFGWIACLVLSLIAAAVVGIGIVVALNDQGNPNDVNSNLGELHVNDPTGIGADILVVQGTWVYDSAHSGWNEIHPIKHCQRIGTWYGYWDVGSTKDWCDAVATTSSPLTTDAQSDPENQWNIHPLVDGCLNKGDGSQPRQTKIR